MRKKKEVVTRVCKLKMVLNNDETKVLRSQIATSKEGRGGRRYNPYAFTEQGVAM